MSYQERDSQVVDYEPYLDERSGLELRGPRPPPLRPGHYGACVGAAQTWGCFVARPFPARLQDALETPVWNLGVGGAGPRFFLRPELLDALNAARFVVVQVMSARSESNAHFETAGHNQGRRRADGEPLFAQDAWQEVFDRDGRWWPFRPGRKIVNRLLALTDRRDVRRLVAETRANYLASYRELLEAIERPKILLWFSERSPDRRDDYRDVHTLFDAFPHLVNRPMVDELAASCDDYVEVVSRRGLPQRLTDRETGEPIAIDPGKPHAALGTGGLWTHNRYYPSPEMHEDVTEKLLPVVRRYQSPSS